jgi:arylsulfatase A-like enzyme
MELRKKLWASAPKGSEAWHEGRRVFQNLSAELVGDSGDIEERNPDGIKARVVAELIRESAANEQQFFISFGSSRPHTPLRAPQKYFDLYDPSELTLSPAVEKLDRNIPPVAKRFGRNWDIFKIRDADETAAREALLGYYACASFIDDQIGLIIEALEEAGVADNTIIIFTSDHGFHLGEHGMWSKLSLFEQSTRVPLMIKIPGVTKGEVTDAIVELVDLYPSICELLNIPLPHDKLEGISLLPVIDEPGRDWKQAAFTVCLQGRYLGRSVRTASHRYTEWVMFDHKDLPDPEVQFSELYNLEVDPWEQNNLAGIPEYTAKKDQMAARLKSGWQNALPSQN